VRRQRQGGLIRDADGHRGGQPQRHRGQSGQAASGGRFVRFVGGFGGAQICQFWPRRWSGRRWSSPPVACAPRCQWSMLHPIASTQHPELHPRPISQRVPPASASDSPPKPIVKCLDATPLAFPLMTPVAFACGWKGFLQTKIAAEMSKASHQILFETLPENAPPQAPLEKVLGLIQAPFSSTPTASQTTKLHVASCGPGPAA